MMQVENKDDAMLTIDGFFVLALSLVFFTAVTTRGNDYANGDSEFTARRLSAVENAAPLWLWGIVFSVVGCSGIIFLMFRIWQGVIIAHILSGGLYSTIAFGLFLDVAARSSTHPTNISALMGLTIFVAVLAFVRMCMGKKYSGIIFLFAVIALGLSLLSAPLDGIRASTYLIASAFTNFIIAISIAQNKAQYESLESKLEGA